MKKNHVMTIIIVLALMPGSIVVGNCRKAILTNYGDAEQMVKSIAQAYNITEPAHKKLLYAATQPNSPTILGYESDPYLFGYPYPSNVLSAARDLACQLQGEGSKEKVVKYTSFSCECFPTNSCIMVSAPPLIIVQKHHNLIAKRFCGGWPNCR